jgi:hypothetical protein
MDFDVVNVILEIPFYGKTKENFYITTGPEF